VKRRIVLIALPMAIASCGRGDAGRTESRESEVADAGARARVAEVHESAVPEEFAEELGIDLSAMRSTASGLYIQELEDGRGLGARAGHVLYVHYTGWLPNGEKFDGSLDRNQPFDFQLGAEQVIRGWEEGIAGMRIGGKRRLVIPPHLAYGARGRGPIPPNATLIFEIELLDIKM
jgi:FKBP-type peptidyl-prolyl cis-trans isomerase FkpA